MHCYWIRDRVNQNQFEVYWAPGAQNLADYFTKHHSATRHQRVRSTYLDEPVQYTANALLQDPHCEGVLIAMAQPHVATIAIYPVHQDGHPA